jgi:pimeloyl-ACP methyl ester carboxylesterase/uncharacterized protein (DUF1330 family)
MTAYFVVYQSISDPERYEQYLNAVMPEIEHRGGRFIARGTPEVLEGPLPWSQAVVLEWRSRQDFLDFWHSDEYAAIEPLREGAADWQAAIVEGVHSSASTPRLTTYRTIAVDGLNIFYRQAGSPDAPTLLLLHGFPTSSRMFRNLMPALADRFHLVATDYPGFGYSSMPTVDEFDYSFDRLAEVMEHFIEALGLEHYSLYLMDYGAPIGYRIAVNHPERVDALIVQNGNAYEEGLREFWEPLKAYWQKRTPDNADRLRQFLTLEATQWQYTHGVRHPEAIDPDNWQLDRALLERPGNEDIQLALFYSYGSNPPLYPQWQEYFRQHQPSTLVVWGKNDSIFPADGAYPYLRDLRDIEFHLLDTGHFALEEEGDAIASYISRFLSSRVN